MTNQYFNHDNPLDRHTLGRAELVNAIFEAVVAGFDKLPNPDLINQAAQTYADDTGAANAYVVSLPKAPQAYMAGLTITMRAANANTGASTINVDGLGAKTIKRYSGDPLIAGDILVGQLVVLGYDGTDFRLVGVHGGEVELARQWATSLTTVGSGLKGSRGYAQDSAASAGAAKDSEDAALLSEQNTEALYVDFRKRYYGQYASDPATDPLGNAPQGGALYYNTTAKEMRIYDADDDSWSAIGMGTLQTFVFTAAGGETSLSGLDDNNRALNYSPGFELVYLNGARLVPGDDYVASNGSTITGLTALSPGDVVIMDAFTRFSLTEERLSLINNIAALRLKSGAAGFDRAWLKCHTTDGDGGHGPFRWVSGAAPGTYVDNNGTIIVPTGGDGSAAWLRDYSGDVLVDWFGAKGDASSIDSTPIQSAIDALSAIYMATGQAQTLRFTDGKTYVLRLVYLKPGVNLVANGGAVLLKTPAGSETNEAVLKWWRMFDTDQASFASEASCDHRILIAGLIFDGNLENMNWTDNTYNQEQAHCLFVNGSSSPVSANARAKFHVRDCHFRNSVADGLSQHRNSDVIAENITADNCFRGGLVSTGGNSRLTVRDYIGENARLDVEVDGAGFGGSYRLDCDIDGVIIDLNGGGIRPGGIDFGGSRGGYFNMRNAQVFTPPFNFGDAEVGPDKLIENCYFTVGGRSSSSDRFVRPFGTFKQCTFYVKEQVGASSYTALHIFPSTRKNAELKFIECTFELDPAIKANTPSADCDVLRLNPTRVTVGGNNEGFSIKFRDCESIGLWNIDFHIFQGGRVIVENGSYSSGVVFRLVSSGGYPSQLTIKGRIDLKDSVNTLNAGANQATQAGAFVEFQDVKLSRAVAIGSTWFTYPIIGNYSFPVDSEPISQGAIRGAVARKNTGLTTTGQWGVIEWVAVTSSTGSATWRPLRFEIGKSTTANRPSLTSSDIGVMYLDTTLDADGKPIWWNGTAWVDATGATV